VQLSIFLIDLSVGTYRLSSHARLEAFVIQTKLSSACNGLAKLRGSAGPAVIKHKHVHHAHEQAMDTCTHTRTHSQTMQKCTHTHTHVHHAHTRTTHTRMRTHTREPCTNHAHVYAHAHARTCTYKTMHTRAQTQERAKGFCISLHCD